MCLLPSSQQGSAAAWNARRRSPAKEIPFCSAPRQFGDHRGQAGAKRTTSVSAPLLRPRSAEGKLVRSREIEARTQVPPQAPKSHVYGSGTFSGVQGCGV